MKTAQAQELADRLVKETGKKGRGEPTAKTMVECLASAVVNLARIADALELGASK